MAIKSKGLVCYLLNPGCTVLVEARSAVESVVVVVDLPQRSSSTKIDQNATSECK